MANWAFLTSICYFLPFFKSWKISLSFCPSDREIALEIWFILETLHFHGHQTLIQTCTGKKWNMKQEGEENFILSSSPPSCCSSREKTSIELILSWPRDWLLAMDVRSTTAASLHSRSIASHVILLKGEHRVELRIRIFYENLGCLPSRGTFPMQ